MDQCGKKGYSPCWRLFLPRLFSKQTKRIRFFINFKQPLFFWILSLGLTMIPFAIRLRTESRNEADKLSAEESSPKRR